MGSTARSHGAPWPPGARSLPHVRWITRIGFGRPAGLGVLLTPASEGVQYAEHVRAGRGEAAFVAGAPPVAVGDADEHAGIDHAASQFGTMLSAIPSPARKS